MKILSLIVVTFVASIASAEKYQLDTSASSILWKAGKKIGSFHNGAVKTKSGTIETDDKGAIKSIEVVADMSTISNDDLKEKADLHGRLLKHLASEDFFMVAKHAESTFKLISITPKAGSTDEFSVKGDLTMIGNTAPIEFTAKIKNDKTTISGTATLEIERLKWNLKYGSGSIFKSLTADKIINDKFEITLSLVAKK